MSLKFANLRLVKSHRDQWGNIVLSFSSETPVPQATDTRIESESDMNSNTVTKRLDETDQQSAEKPQRKRPERRKKNQKNRGKKLPDVRPRQLSLLQKVSLFVPIVRLYCMHYHIDGLVQERHALAVQLRLSYTNPSISYWAVW